MYRNNYLFIYIIFFGLTFGQAIYHDSPKEFSSHTPFSVDVLTDFNNQSYISYILYYRIDGQLSYFQQPMIAEDNGYYHSIIPANHIISGNVEYFIQLEMSNGNIISLPDNSPNVNPFIIKIIDDDYSNQNTMSNVNFLKSDVTILSPLPYENILADDFMISLSYFQLEGIDVESIEILLDNINITDRAIIKTNHLVIDPPQLYKGRHSIKVTMYNNYGISFEPIIWTFNIVSDEIKLSQDQKFKYNGRIWNDYLNNTVDALETSYNTFNFNFNGKTEWLNFSTKLKKSSLENILEQPKDRYLLKLDNKYFKINYGDFYPQLGDYGLSGNRLRGAGIIVNTKYFQMHLVQGELNRAVQGNPNEGALAIADYSDLVDDDGVTETVLTLSRDKYTFQRDLSGLRIAFGDKEKANFGLNIIKAKDNIASINNNFVEGSIINLDKFIEYYGYNSDQFGDLDTNDVHSDGDFLYTDYNNDATFTDITLINEDFCLNTPDITLCEKSIIDIGTYQDDTTEDSLIVTIKQEVWNIELIYENEAQLKEILDNVFPEESYDISINELNEHWIGDKPQDNFVIGTDMKLNFNNLVRIKSGIAMSLQNTNTWNPIKTVDDFDTYADEHEDCYYARTYTNLDSENDCTDDMTDDDETTECVANSLNYYWNDCAAYIYVDGDDNDVELSLVIDESGIALSDIPNPEDFADIIHFNFDSVPLIPFYSLLQKQQNDESISIEDIFNSPEIAFNLDFILSLKKQKVQFGIKQVGASFNSLGNPYLQKDTRKKYFNNTLRFLKNKLFLNLKWESVKNGLVSGSSSSKTDKYDINFSFYPGVNLPSITMGYGIYDKSSGEASILDTSSIDDNFSDNTDLDELLDFDSRIKTKTTNMIFTLSQNFKVDKYNYNFSLSYFDSDKEDELFKELNESNDDYISPRSKSSSTSINLKTTYNSFWSSNIYFTNNYFDFAQQTSEEFYQEQDFSMLSIGFNYTDNKIINKISTTLDYSVSDGLSIYHQFGLRVLTKFNLLDDLNLILDFNKRFKVIESDDLESEQKYSNSIFKANLSYKF